MNHNDPEKHHPGLSSRIPMSSRSTTSDTHPAATAQNVDNPFATPGTQTPNPNASASTSRRDSDTDSNANTSGYRYFPAGTYFRSRRVKKDEIERPWLEKKDPREKWMTIIPLIGIFLGLCVVGVLVWDGMRSVAQHNYCLVLDEDFSSWNSDIWTKEVEVGGYGSVSTLVTCRL
jgi:hypothetical protein